MNLLARFDRSGQRSLYRPARTKTPNQSALAHSYLIGPLGDSQAFAAKLKKAVGYSVICLFFWSCPSAIVREVSQVVVDAVNTVLWAWTRAHIFNEVFRTILPTLTNGYTSTSIQFVAFGIRLCATADHGGPAIILRHMTKAVSFISLGKLLAMQAPATLGLAIYQIVNSSGGFIAAITDKKPRGNILTNLSDVSKHNKTTKPLSSQVFDPLVCNGNNFWGIIHGVFGPPRPLTKPGAFIAPPGIFVYLHSFILPFFDRFGGVSSLTVKAVA